MEELKLFVIGESSGNPDDWTETGRRVLVAARNAAEAESMAPSLARIGVSELNVKKPHILFSFEDLGNEE